MKTFLGFSIAALLLVGCQGRAPAPDPFHKALTDTNIQVVETNLSTTDDQLANIKSDLEDATKKPGKKTKAELDFIQLEINVVDAEKAVHDIQAEEYMPDVKDARKTPEGSTKIAEVDKMMAIQDRLDAAETTYKEAQHKMEKAWTDLNE